MKLKGNKMKKQYKFGECIPYSKKIYRSLEKKGYNPIMVEGWVEVDNYNDILPDEYFLARFFPKEFEKLNDIEYSDYPKNLQHTWVEVKGHKIDITGNQFDKYGGIKKYYIYEIYKLEKQKLDLRA